MRTNSLPTYAQQCILNSIDIKENGNKHHCQYTSDPYEEGTVHYDCSDSPHYDYSEYSDSSR